MAERWEASQTPENRLRRASRRSPRGSVDGQSATSQRPSRVNSARMSVPLDEVDVLGDVVSVFQNYQSTTIFSNLLETFFQEFAQYITNNNTTVIENLIKVLINEFTEYFETHDNSTTNNFAGAVVKVLNQYFEDHSNSLDVKNFINNILDFIVYVQPDEPDTNKTGTLWFDTDA